MFYAGKAFSRQYDVSDTQRVFWGAYISTLGIVPALMFYGLAHAYETPLLLLMATEHLPETIISPGPEALEEIRRYLAIQAEWGLNLTPAGESVQDKEAYLYAFNRFQHLHFISYYVIMSVTALLSLVGYFLARRHLASRPDAAAECFARWMHFCAVLGLVCSVGIVILWVLGQASR